MHKLFIAGLALLTSAPVTAANRAEQELATLVAAERGFAADAARLGVREAFVAHLAADAWLFRPQPTRAKAWFDTHPARSGVMLAWTPEFAEIAASGDFGYTFGPYRSEATTPQGGQSGFGHFVSVWKRDADGNWKNVLDHGIEHAEVSLEPGLTLHAPGLSAVAAISAEVLAERRRELLAADDALNGPDAAAQLERLAAGDLRRFRDGSVPDAARSSVPGLRRVADDMAASGDLAYTLGGRTDAKTDAAGGYVRIWRRLRDGGWRLVLDCSAPPA